MNIKEGQIKGLCHGCFDLFHYGHLLHLQEARNYCDYLVVSITSDTYVNKESGRPIFNQLERKALIESLKPVNKVIVSDCITALDALKTIRPSIYFKGPDYKISNDPRFLEETNFCNSIDCKILLTKSQKYSTTEYIKKCKEVVF